MTSHPHEAESDEADPEKLSSPAGVAGDLEEMAEDVGATTDPDQVEVPDVKPPEKST